MARAIFPGSFDPFTKGHASIVERALPLFDEIVIAIGINTSKKPMLSPDEREAAIKKLYGNNSKIRVVQYESLTLDLAKQVDAAFIIRGVRSTIDFEYERPIAEANLRLGGIETIFFFALPEESYISSSLVRELSLYKYDTTNLLP